MFCWPTSPLIHHPVSLLVTSSNKKMCCDCRSGSPPLFFCKGHWVSAFGEGWGGSKHSLPQSTFKISPSSVTWVVSVHLETMITKHHHQWFSFSFCHQCTKHKRWRRSRNREEICRWRLWKETGGKAKFIPFSVKQELDVHCISYEYSAISFYHTERPTSYSWRPAPSHLA